MTNSKIISQYQKALAVAEEKLKTSSGRAQIFWTKEVNRLKEDIAALLEVSK